MIVFEMISGLMVFLIPFSR